MYVPYRYSIALMVTWLFAMSASAQETKMQTQDSVAPIASFDFEDEPFLKGLRFSSDGSKLWTNRLNSWSVSRGTKLTSSPIDLQKNSSFIYDLAAKQSLMLIVDRKMGKLSFWDQAKKPSDRPLLQNGQASAGRFIDNGKRFALVFADPPSVYLGDVNSIKNDVVLPISIGADKCVISPDGDLVAVRSDAGIKLWDVKDENVRSILPHKNRIFSFAFNNDGRLMATGTAQDNVVRLFDTSKGELIAEMKGHGEGTIFLTAAIYSLAFSPNGKWLASGGHDGRVVAWDLNSRKPILKAQIAGPPIVSSIAFSPDSKLVAGSFENASAKRGIRVWKLP